MVEMRAHVTRETKVRLGNICYGDTFRYEGLDFMCLRQRYCFHDSAQLVVELASGITRYISTLAWVELTKVVIETWPKV